MTEIVCKCGVTRLEDIQCAECGETFRLAWIPVSERLPEFVEDVIVMHYPSRIVGVAWYESNGWYCLNQWGAVNIAVVSHWMPKPPPPEAE